MIAEQAAVSSSAAVVAFSAGAVQGRRAAAVERAELEAELAAVKLPTLDAWTAVA